MFRFLHASDLHLDTQPSGLYGYPADIAEVLRDASLQAFDNLVGEAISQDVAFCVFAGDIYDGAERGARAELAFRNGLNRLADAGIPSFIVHGNHDPLEAGWSTVTTWPEAVKVFRASSPETVEITVGATTVAVHGVSYAQRVTTDNLSARFRRHSGSDVQIGILHTNAGSNANHDPYAPCSVADLVAVGLDYWALGHIHERQTLHGPSPWIVYPGNLQGRNPKASERGAKGAVIVTVNDSGVISEPSFVALDVLRFVAPIVSVDDLADLGELNDVLSTTAETLREEHAGRALVVSATLVGHGPVHSLLADPESTSEFLDALRSEWVGRSPVLWWDRLVNRTQAEFSLEELRGRDDLVGATLNAIARTPDESSPPDATAANLLGPLRALSPSLTRLGVELPDIGDPAMIDRAQLLAAELLTESDH